MALPVALQARVAMHSFIVPRANAEEATLVEGCQAWRPITGCKSAHLTGSGPLAVHGNDLNLKRDSSEQNLADVRGQHRGRRP